MGFLDWLFGRRKHREQSDESQFTTIGDSRGSSDFEYLKEEQTEENIRRERHEEDQEKKRRVDEQLKADRRKTYNKYKGMVASVLENLRQASYPNQIISESGYGIGDRTYDWEYSRHFYTPYVQVEIVFESDFSNKPVALRSSLTTDNPNYNLLQSRFFSTESEFSQKGLIQALVNLHSLLTEKQQREKKIEGTS